MISDKIPFYTRNQGTFMIEGDLYYCVLELSTEETLVRIFDTLETKASEFYGVPMFISDMSIAISPLNDTVNLVYFKPVGKSPQLIM